MKNRHLWIGGAVSALFLWLALRQVKFAELQQELAEANLAYLPGLIALVVGDLTVRAVRWKLLLPKSDEVTTWRLFRLEAMGLAVNNVLPLRIGELARAYLTSRETGLPLMTILASIVIERIFDMLTLLGFIVFIGDWGGGPLAALKPWARLGFFGLAGLLIAIAWMERHPWSPFRKVPQLDRFMEQAALGAKALAEPGRAALVVALGIVLWGVDGFTFFAGAASMDVPGMTFALSITTLCAAAASTALPAVPGYFGTYEFAVSKVLVQAGVAQSKAFGLAGFVHLIQFATTTLLGLAFLYGEGHTLENLKQQHQRGDTK